MLYFPADMSMYEVSEIVEGELLEIKATQQELALLPAAALDVWATINPIRTHQISYNKTGICNMLTVDFQTHIQAKEYQVLAAVVDYTTRAGLRIYRNAAGKLDTGPKVGYAVDPEDDDFQPNAWSQFELHPRLLQASFVGPNNKIPSSRKRLLERVIQSVVDPHEFTQAWKTYLVNTRKVRHAAKVIH